MMNVNGRFLGRVLIYVLGLLSLALGVAFSINSRLGISPVNSLPYVVSKITGQDMGTMVIAIFALFLLIQILILKKEFRWINMSQLIFSTMFGYFVNFAKTLVGDFSIPTYAGQLLMLLISISFVAIGVSLYVNVKLVNMPMEGMTMAVKDKFFPKRPFHDVKVIMDCTVVTTGIILSLIFLGGITGIREGTVLCALLVGKFMKPIQKLLVPGINRICFSTPSTYVKGEQGIE